MDNLKTQIVKILAMWTAIGTFLLTIGSIGIVDVPSNLIDLFSQEVADQILVLVDLLIQAWGASIIIAQIVRGIFVANEPSAKIKTLSDNKVLKSFKLNPYKLVG